MNEPTVDTANGTLRGIQEGHILVFKGVPYASPPTGGRRFRPPQPIEPWTGTRNAMAYGHIAPQDPDPLTDLIPGCRSLFYHPTVSQSEDCLNLNIWTPALIGSRPVLVWIHGGAFVGGSGSSPWLDGSHLAALHDVVVVTINYRLGILGALMLDDPDSELGYVSNAGLLDQVAALEWVRDNIASFGGDPMRVCVGGGSAGAMSVVAILTMPAARGLYSRAIVQSGHAGFFDDDATSRAISKHLLALLSVPNDGGALAALSKIDIGTLLIAQRSLAAERPMPFRYAVDGKHLPQQPSVALKTGSHSLPPLIIGTNADEAKLFRAVSSMGGTSNSHELLVAPALGAQARDFVTELIRSCDGMNADDAWDLVTTDLDWRIPVRTIADTYASAGAQVYVYEFDWRTAVLNGQLGACHALEVPFVFDNLRRTGVASFVGDDPETLSSAAKLAKVIGDYWTSFAREGCPDADGMPLWPPYDTNSRQLMVLGHATEVTVDPHHARIERLLSSLPVESIGNLHWE